MIPIKRVCLFAGAATLTLTGGSFADTSLEDQNQELRARIAELESRLTSVEQQSDANWLTEQRADEIKSLVEDVLADADTRSSLLAQGMTAGYDNGAVIASADGNWSLRTNILMQTRFMIRSQDEAAVPPTFDNTVWGFEVTRAKFMLTGNVVSPEWFYKLEIETSGNASASASGPAGTRVDARTGLEDAYIGYDYGNGWKVLAGNMKVPLLYEDLMQTQYQQAVERSVLTYMYTGGRSTGLAVDYMGDQFHVMGMWNNGISDGLYGGGVAGGVGTTNNTPALVSDTSVSFTVRGEWLAMGTWDQFKDYTSPQGDETGVMVGAAIHYQTAESDGLPVGLTDVELFTLAIDATAELGGGNVYVAFVYSDVSGLGAPGPPFGGSPWGFQVGGGWYFAEDWELFGRYEYSDTDNLATDDLSIITGGVTKYFAGHNAKWTTDIGFGLDAVEFGVPVTGFNSEAPGDDGQFVLRTQLQIVF